MIPSTKLLLKYLNGGFPYPGGPEADVDASSLTTEQFDLKHTDMDLIFSTDKVSEDPLSLDMKNGSQGVEHTLRLALEHLGETKTNGGKKAIYRGPTYSDSLVSPIARRKLLTGPNSSAGGRLLPDSILFKEMYGSK